MLGPIWLSWPFAGLMVISALCHAGRLMVAREHGKTHGYDVDLTHLVTSCAMAAMLVVTFGVYLATACAVLVGVPTLWFALRALRAMRSNVTRAFVQPGQQVLMGAAMLFMLSVAGRSAAASTGVIMDRMGMPGMAMGDESSQGSVGSASSVAVTSVVLVGFLCLVAARHARQLTVAVATHGAWPTNGAWPTDGRLDLRQRGRALLLAPGLSLGCQLAMSGTMIYMLVLMWPGA